VERYRKVREGRASFSSSTYALPESIPYIVIGLRA